MAATLFTGGCRVPTARDFTYGFAATQAVASVAIGADAIASRDDDANWNVQLWGSVGMLGVAALTVALAYLIPKPAPETRAKRLD